MHVLSERAKSEDPCISFASYDNPMNCVIDTDMNLVEEPERKQFPLIAKIINGGIAGIIGVTSVFPLDLVKTRLQSERIQQSGSHLYNSMWDCFKKTYKAEGFLGMYRGLGVNIFFITPEKAIKLTVNDICRYYLSSGSGEQLPLKFEILAGGTAGLCQVVVTTPMELLKVQLQNAGLLAAKGHKDTITKVSATSIAVDLLKEKGILGLYKGVNATLLRDISFSIIYFPLFAHLNDVGPRKKTNPDAAVFWITFLAGCLSASVASFAVTPFDVVKTRLQLLKTVDSEIRYSGIVDAMVKIMKNEGPLTFLKGGCARMLAIAPIFGIAQMVYYLGVAEYLMGIKK